MKYEEFMEKFNELYDKKMSRFSAKQCMILLVFGEMIEEKDFEA